MNYQLHLYNSIKQKIFKYIQQNLVVQKRTKLFQMRTHFELNVQK